MSAAERAVVWALEIAADDAHGYDQAQRWGPDYDCSALVITAWEQAGVPVKSDGATYTGNMKAVFLRCGFAEVTDGTRLRGDVLLNEQHHTALCLGGGQLVQASSNERGGVRGGVGGDQTGREIAVRAYYDYPWDCVLRYTGDAPAQPEPWDCVLRYTGDAPAQPEPWAGAPELRRGDGGDGVAALQHLLLLAGHGLPAWGADGELGEETDAALRAFQLRCGLEADGVCGAATWAALTG